MQTINQEHSDYIYDRAKHHFLGNFPALLPIEQAYVHIGMYLGWIVEKDLYSSYFEDESGLQMLRFRRRELSCTILSEIWDGYLGKEIFNEEGNSFTAFYYQGGYYAEDYKSILGKGLPTIYHVEDCWKNYEIIFRQITLRYQEWIKVREQV